MEGGLKSLEGKTAITTINSIIYSQNIIDNLEKLSQQQKFITNLPITQKLYDNLTFLEPASWEILIPANESDNISKLKESYESISVPPKLFNLCERFKVKVSIQSTDSEIKISALSPELSVIYTLRMITIPRLFVALGILQHCNIEQLKKLQMNYYPTQEKIIDFIIDLASIRLHRSDMIWKLLQKHNFQDALGRLSLYLRDFIKNEFIYEKVV